MTTAPGAAPLTPRDPHLPPAGASSRFTRRDNGWGYSAGTYNFSYTTGTSTALDQYGGSVPGWASPQAQRARRRNEVVGVLLMVVSGLALLGFVVYMVRSVKDASQLVLPAALARLPEALRPRVRHQVGPAHVAATAALYAAAGLTADIVPFIDDMPGAYAEADWVIARAGASTVAELATVGLGAVLVPYPHAVDDHQYYNALTLAGSGGAEVARQENLSPERLALMISARSDRAVLLQHAEAVRTLSHADALGRITAALATLLQE